MALLGTDHDEDPAMTWTIDRPTREEIARLAYHFYEARGRRDGHELEDWLAAEQQLIHHYR